MNKLINNLDKLHTTELGVLRLRKNLSLYDEDVISWSKEKINNSKVLIKREGKNWYVSIDDIILTINSSSYTIITGHRKKIVKGEF